MDKEIVISLNNTGVDCQCELCRGWFDPEVGPQLFVAGTGQLVCPECGWKYVPILQGMIAAYEAYERARFEEQDRVKALLSKDRAGLELPF